MASIERLPLAVMPTDPIRDSLGFELLGNQLQVAIEDGYASGDQGMLEEAWRTNPYERRTYWTNVAQMHVGLGREVANYPDEIRERAVLYGQPDRWRPEDIFGVMRRVIERINPRVDASQPLMQHLLEMQRESEAFLLTPRGESRFPKLMGNEMAQAIAWVVAPTHDLLKFLSLPCGQVMRDHEQVAAWILRQHFGGIDELHGIVGKAAGLVSNHENVFKQDWHRKFSVHAPDELGRARGVFFVLDVMTGVFELDEAQFVRINRDKLKSRFEDLYLRHIDRSNPYANVFSPEWGPETIGVAVDMFCHMQEWGWVAMEEGWERVLWESGYAVTERAMEYHYIYKPGSRLAEAQYLRVRDVRDWFDWKLENVESSL